MEISVMSKSILTARDVAAFAIGIKDGKSRAIRIIGTIRLMGLILPQ
jgi:hypothetical protein